jgi:AraC-like DNA-binding protein
LFEASDLRAVDPYPKAYLYRRVVQAKLFIDGHYAEAIDVRAICGEAAFSKFHFIRLFKQVYDRPPHAYLTHVRVERAMALLREGMAATDACFAVGFVSMGSFSRLFKRCVGITPSAYRIAELRKRTELMERPLDFIPGCFASANGWL